MLGKKLQKILTIFDWWERGEGMPLGLKRAEALPPLRPCLVGGDCFGVGFN